MEGNVKYFVVYRSMHLNGSQNGALIPAMDMKEFTDIKDALEFIKSNKQYLFTHKLIKGNIYV